ncbi:MAG: molybdopterin-synthase adenylyltransferase MoeB [Lachnospiraceae bacterium]|nr:molybdopterin-synthase adenylyltransferase MoeB [Lachnospiraceae bacterium]
MKVYISSTLRGFFGRKEKIEIEGTTIRQVLEGLLREYPDAEKAVYDENREIRSFIQIYVNEENVTSEEYWSRELAVEDEILLLPVIAGGAPEDSLISDDRRKEIKLDDAEIDRFNKHLMLKEIGVKGQKRLKAAKVAVIGAGALGSPVIQYLATAGVGTIKVIDFDEVSLENLQSQVIHGTRDVKRPKTASARDTIRAINPKIKVEIENVRAGSDNIEELIEGYDVAADCTDNYKARYLISDACALHGIPLVFGAIYQYEGQVGIFNRNGGPCLRCLFPAPPPVGLVPTCAGSGTISSLPGIIGSIQANEILKLIIGIGEHLDGKILVVDSLNLRSRILDVHKRENCPICGKNPSITEVEDFDYEDFCGLKQKEDEVPIEGIGADELAERIERGDELTLVDVREPHERAIHRFSNAIAIPIGQLARRQKELNPDIDTIFICKEGQRSILAIRTLREAGYKGPMYNLRGGIDAMKGIIFSNEGGWL